MIKSFGNKTAADIYHGTGSRYARKLPATLHEKARRLLDQVNAAPTVDFLKCHLATGLKSCQVITRDSGVSGSTINGGLFLDG